MRARREFTVADQVAIVRRATVDGRVHCERCGIWVPKRKDWQIDHVLPEGMRPAADLKRKLVAADGQLLCVAVCHKEKTRRDKGDIAEGKRREAASLSLGKRWRRPVKEKPPLRVANGKPRIAREYGQ